MKNYIKKRNLHVILQIVLFVVLIAVDQITKIVATNCLKGNPAVVLIKDVLEFNYLENTGAAFGSLKNAFWLFYILTIVVFVVILIIWINLSKRLKTYSALIETDSELFKEKTFNDNAYLGYLLAALGAGAIGNLIDRINTQYVVDFIYFKLIDFPIFNFADICVTVSVILLCILLIFTYKEDPNFKIFGSKKKKEKKSTWERYTIDKNENANDNKSNPEATGENASNKTENDSEEPTDIKTDNNITDQENTSIEKSE